MTSLRSAGTDAAARADSAWELLSAVGARRTVARVQVIRVLAAVDGHVSVTAIHDRIAADQPEINVSTVHRTIGYLLEHGVVHVLSWPGERLYGLADQPHHHAVCASCGALDELPAAPLAAAAAAAGTGSTLDIDGATVTLSGLCRTCRDR